MQERSSLGQGEYGLSRNDVISRINAGKTNLITDENSKTTSDIVKENVVTYFNIIFAALAVLLIIAGSFRSLTFLPVIIVNTIIGIVQQLRSKKVLDKLSVLSKSTYEVIRDGKQQRVPVDKLVLDDSIILREGQQIPADAVVKEGKIFANESLLTGESDEIEKLPGSELKSGSFVISGTCIAALTAVGNDSYAAQLTAKAKAVKDKQSELIRNIELIIKIAGILIIPIGITLFYQALFINHHSFSDAVVSSVGAIIGMIPEGLYLLVTIALALSSIKLARQKVLLHDMRSIEALARADILCVDKTGTITSDTMEVVDVFSPYGVSGNELSQNKEILVRYINTVPDNNITMQALRAFFGSSKVGFDSARVTPFSSKYKYSQIETRNGTYRLGAPDILLRGRVLEANDPLIEEYSREGLRVLALVKVDENRSDPLAFIAIKNGIRKNAEKIFAFFEEQGVEIKVISGDNPLTVSRIAGLVGIKNNDKYVDASKLQTKEDFDDAVLNYTVFGRVKPEQKKELVLALKRKKLKVAMTGDGVNDILAMKEADCSIAMGTGSDAARQAAQIVLLDSDFSRMKSIVTQGRQIVNNITRSATLFLYKNMFSAFLAIFSIAMLFTYPLKPSQISLVSLFNIGVPAFLLSLETNTVKQKQNFLKRTILTALPAALTSFLSIAALVVFGEVFDISNKDVGIASTYLLAIVGFLILQQVSKPPNVYKIIIFIGCILGFIIFALVPQLRDLFMLTEFSDRGIMLCVVFAFAEITVMRYMTFLFFRLLKVDK
ncbi:MAG: HAD-IC family P-type ATPase [Clostridia bacterium]|nr:HAD-IC family P-type ATPase [Clostridia bacterium]